MPEESLVRTRSDHFKQLGALHTERATWDYHYQELAENIRPRAIRFNRQDVNSGTKRNAKIFSSAPTYAARITESGLMAGCTSPARPWFRLLPADPALMQHRAVRTWLGDEEDRLRWLFERTNIYNALAQCYRDLVIYGSHAMLLEEETSRIMRAYSLPVGSYCFAANELNTVDTIYHETSMSVWQLNRRFGLGACSPNVKLLADRREWDRWIPVLHVIEPRGRRDPALPYARQLPWRSVWYEVAGLPDVTLGEGGYQEFPGACPRWDITGEDVYGGSPAMEALADIKELQTLVRRLLEIAAAMSRPPLNAPAGLIAKGGATLVPGEVNYMGAEAGQAKVEPVIQYDPRVIAVLEARIQSKIRDVKEGMFALLFSAFLSYEGPEQTAREVIEKSGEKVFQLGPFLERLHDEALRPIIDRGAGMLQRAGMEPPRPDILRSTPIKVEFRSPVAQAMRELGAVPVERMFAFVGSLSASYPDALDNLDPDEAIVEYASITGLPPKILRSPETIAGIRRARSEERQAAQLAAAAKPASDAANAAQTLAGTDVAGTPALQRLLSATVPPGQVPAVAGVQ